MDEEVVDQIRKVLKLKVGEQVLLCDGQGNEVVGEITEIVHKVIKLKVLKVQKNENEAGWRVVLYCAILKRENFELVVQKATEIGVAEIVPVVTRRTVKLDIKQERLQKIIKEAAEQSGRGVVPILREPIIFQEAIKNANGANILFDSSGSIQASNSKLLTSIAIWIGPEGGFDEAEITAAKNAGFEIASLGKLTLRAETAAIVASYLVTK